MKPHDKKEAIGKVKKMAEDLGLTQDMKESGEHFEFIFKQAKVDRATLRGRSLIDAILEATMEDMHIETDSDRMKKVVQDIVIAPSTALGAILMIVEFYRSLTAAIIHICEETQKEHQDLIIEFTKDGLMIASKELMEQPDKMH